MIETRTTKQIIEEMEDLEREIFRLNSKLYSEKYEDELNKVWLGLEYLKKEIDTKMITEELEKIREELKKIDDENEFSICLGRIKGYEEALHTLAYIILCNSQEQKVSQIPKNIKSTDLSISALQRKCTCKKPETPFNTRKDLCRRCGGEL